MGYSHFVDHLVYRVHELARTERFYTALLGPPAHKTEDSLMYKAGITRLFFTLPIERQKKLHEKERIGLNHIAFGVRTPEELEAIQIHLDKSGISHSGIQVDHYGSKEFIWIDDPDGMRVEFYLRSED